MTDEQAWARWQQQGKGRLTLTEAEQQRLEEIRFRVQEAAPVNLYADRKWLLSLIQRPGDHAPTGDASSHAGSRNEEA